MADVDALVVGAGVVGLACARELARAGLEVVIAEAGTAIGTGISSRNSEVLHAGLHGAPDSLKSRLCRTGREALMAYCQERGVPHRRCGKLLVAPQATDLPALERLAAQAAAAGLTEVQPLEGAAARRLEPALHCAAALWLPYTGIVDSHALMLALLGDAQDAGAVLALASPVHGARRLDGAWQVHGGADEPFEIRTRWLVNCAGLGAQSLARHVEGLPAAQVPPLHPARGHYFSLSGRVPFSRLVYPVPEPGGLGIHLTLDLQGRARFGPDVQWLDASAADAPDYRVDPALAPRFEADIRRWWPGLPGHALQPDYAGIRPKLSGPGEPAKDFVLSGPAQHGLPGLVQCFGIESPGLTACLALAGEVAARVRAGDA